MCCIDEKLKYESDFDRDIWKLTKTNNKYFLKS